jgi:hypothetical protein
MPRPVSLRNHLYVTIRCVGTDRQKVLPVFWHVTEGNREWATKSECMITADISQLVADEIALIEKKAEQEVPATTGPVPTLIIGERILIVYVADKSQPKHILLAAADLLGAAAPTAGGGQSIISIPPMASFSLLIWVFPADQIDSLPFSAPFLCAL